MAKLFGKTLTKREILDGVGNLAQVAGARRMTLQDGREQGIDAVEIRTGGGLCYTLLPGRALDIAYATYRGIPVSFLSKSGIRDSRYFYGPEKPWGGNFFGGMMTTCGLTSVGVGAEYNGRFLPTHGNISNIPAELAGTFEEWDGDEMKMGASGTMHQSTMYRESLELKRTVWSMLGENAIHIHDRVENLAAEKSPLMLLYHINFGYPLLSGDARCEINDQRTTLAPGKTGDMPDWKTLYDPGKEYPDMLLHHDIIPDADGLCRAHLVNKALGIRATVSFDKTQLKTLCHWTHLFRGDYVTALEPTNCYGRGTAGEEQAGTLEYIEPGEVREFDVTISFEDEAK